LRSPRFKKWIDTEKKSAKGFNNRIATQQTMEKKETATEREKKKYIYIYIYI
jgi:hypothetical protein